MRSPGSLKIERADIVVTLAHENHMVRDADLIIEHGAISYVGPHREEEREIPTVDGRGCWIYPGLVNTHHHMYQSFTRNLPHYEHLPLFPWLKYLYPIWSGISEEVVFYSSLVAMGELLASGCTTTMDHHYVFPLVSGRNLIDRQFEAAERAGMRFHASRGSMSLGVSSGGLPPDNLVQDPEEILGDTERLINRYHDPSQLSMRQVIVAPCSPFTVSAETLRNSAGLARRYGVRLHTHLAETLDEEEYCLEKTGLRPLAYMATQGWTGEDVWYAHAVHLNDEELDLMAQTRTGVAHCATSNMKLSSGISRVREMLERGIPVGLAVDGSASNDSSNMLAELRVAYLLQQLVHGEEAVDASKYLELATSGGARVLGRNDIGTLETGKAGDLFMIRTDRLEFAAALNDPLALPAVLGVHRPVDMTVVNGNVVYRDGEFTGFDEAEVVSKANTLARKLILEE